MRQHNFPKNSRPFLHVITAPPVKKSLKQTASLNYSNYIIQVQSAASALQNCTHRNRRPKVSLLLKVGEKLFGCVVELFFFL